MAFRFFATINIALSWMQRIGYAQIRFGIRIGLLHQILVVVVNMAPEDHLFIGLLTRKDCFSLGKKVFRVVTLTVSNWDEHVETMPIVHGNEQLYGSR